VALPPRPAAVEALLGGAAHDDPRVVAGLLSELSLFFLIYTEGAVMRHFPEGMWFFYWTAAHSPAMAALWAMGPPAAGAPGTRDRRVLLRNELQEEIAALQRRLGHDPSALSPEQCAPAFAPARGALPPHLAAGTPARGAAAIAAAGDGELIAELAAFGDGGFYCDRIVTPVFYMLSYEARARAL